MNPQDYTVETQTDIGMTIIAKSLKSGNLLVEYPLWLQLDEEAREKALLFVDDIKAALKEKFPVGQIREYLTYVPQGTEE